MSLVIRSNFSGPARAKNRGIHRLRGGHLHPYALLAHSRYVYFPPQGQNRLIPPLSHSQDLISHPLRRLNLQRRYTSDESDEERGMTRLSSTYPPSISHSSTSTFSDSVVTTPAFAAFPLHAEFSGSFRPSNYLFLSGHRVILVKSTAGSVPHTRPSSPPNNLNSPNKVLEVHKYTSNMPVPLNCAPKRRGLSLN